MHFSPIPPGERVYAKPYRKELEPLEAQLVEVSGRCKEIREHPERKDLQSLLLVNLQIKPVGRRGTIKLSHLWVLIKHVRRAGVEPKLNRRIRFLGSVYAYFRLGGKSKQRGLLGLHDFSILPMGPLDLESFEPGLKQRYENEESTTGSRRAVKEKRRSGNVGKGKTSRPKRSDRRRRDDGSPQSRPKDRDRTNLDDKP